MIRLPRPMSGPLPNTSARAQPFYRQAQQGYVLDRGNKSTPKSEQNFAQMGMVGSQL